MNWRLLICSLALCDAALWGYVFFPNQSSEPRLYFLSVGQGDSELIDYGGTQILVDGGPNAAVLERLSEILPPRDRYLDVVLLTHPHQDHFAGLIDVLKQYQIGLLIDNGFDRETAQYRYFREEIARQRTPRAVLREGDRIRYRDIVLEIISPPADARPTTAKNIHDNTIVFLLKRGRFSGLFTGDINFKAEDRLLRRYGTALAVQLLKVSHHGSNKSTDSRFLTAVRPRLAIIEVGKNNRYGHPKPQLLERLRSAGVTVYRTDQDGTMRITVADDVLTVAHQPN